MSGPSQSTMAPSGAGGGRLHARIRLSHAAAAFTLIAVIAMGALVERAERTRHLQDLRAETLDALSVLRADLEGRITANVYLVQGLAGVIATEPRMDQARFSELGETLFGTRSQITLVAGAPDLVISMVHPFRGNAAVLGLDYRRHAAQRAAAFRARDLGTTVFAGPVDLVQGGRAFVSRTPVMLRATGGATRFWGLLSTVIDEQALYRASGLLDPDLPFDLVLAGRDGSGADGAVFFGDPARLAQDPVTARVVVPYGSWQMAAVPKGGWEAGLPGPWARRGLITLIGALIVAAVFIAARAIEARRGHDAALARQDDAMALLAQRLSLALDASRVGAWELDIDTGHLIWDARMRDLYGIPDRRGGCDYADWSRAVHPQDRARAEGLLQQAIDTSGAYRADYRLLLYDGEIRHIRAIGAVHEGADGGRRLVGVEWDMTAEIRSREELETRRAQAETAARARSQFLATMSHEIRTPMNGILGLLELILEAPLAPEQRERTAMAREAAQSLLQILNGILDVSRLEARQSGLREEEVPPRALLRDIEALLGQVAGQKGLAFTCTATPAVPGLILADPVRLRQVMMTLAGNAIKFTQAGHVAVRMDFTAPGPSADGTGGDGTGFLRIEIEDTGIGMSEAKRVRLLGARGADGADGVDAVQTPGQTPNQTGLGFAVARQIIARMGGRMEIESRPDAGSTFLVEIPAQVVARDAAASAHGPRDQISAPEASPDPAPGDPAARTGPPRDILLAEDNLTNQHIFRAYLAAAGHRVEIVGTGAAALEAVQARAFDLVLMDVEMPVMDGPAATRAIRALPGPERRIPIVALTANAMAGDRETYLAAGMTDYLSKPVDAATLRAAIERAVTAGSDTPDTGNFDTPDTGDSNTPDTGDSNTPDTGDSNTPDTGDDSTAEAPRPIPRARFG